jgi:integrase
MGMIYKRGKVFWIKYYRNGKPFFESSKSEKEGEARKLLRKREGEISSGKLPGIYFDRVKFGHLKDDLIADYKVNGKKSLRSVQFSLAHLEKFFGGMRVTAITTPKINAYIQDRRQWTCEICEERFDAQNTCPYCNSTKVIPGATNATINRELSALKRMLNLGARQSPPKVDRVPYIPLLRENNIRKGFFEHGDFLALRDALPDHLKGFATFAYKTGWRVSEISNLKWSQVDLAQGIVWLQPGETKNDEGRTVYLDEELREIFKNQKDLRKKNKILTPYVFTNEEGTDRIKDFRKSWNKACEKAKIGKRLFHDFRRTAVRNMVRAGVPERVAMMVSGHKTRSVFERYNIVSDSDLRLAAQSQEEYLRSQTVTKTVTIQPLGTKKEASN